MWPGEAVCVPIMALSAWPQQAIKIKRFGNNKKHYRENYR
ncbi:hypothetical protein CJA_2870 [Cellvibrio japonicus Ueda107]|uniref:Uncharacterized protein n=1 Tax=Cellvibrio japonicus (strain Ueda107) TaxID=498211 RepID=B3PC57_CELJU|nr:hypothetical protein CJA_2870 [Cellvibrio japonicus Ueda107]